MIHYCACRIPSPSLPTATLGHHERRVDETFFFIQRTSVAKLVSNIRQQPPPTLLARADEVIE